MRFVNMNLIANSEAKDEDEPKMICYDEGTVFFHVGIEPSAIPGQRSVTTLCNGPMQGIVLPYIENVVTVDGNKRIGIRHSVLAEGMLGPRYTVDVDVDELILEPYNVGHANACQDMFYM